MKQKEVKQGNVSNEKRGLRGWLAGSLRINGMLYRLLLAWLLASLVPHVASKVPFTSEYFYDSFPLLGMVGITLVLFVVLLLIRHNGFITVLMLVAATAYCIMGVLEHPDIYFAFGCCVFLAALVMFSPLEAVHPKLGKKWGLGAVVGILLVVYTVWIGGVCVLAYLHHWTPNFDFGIFAQMFYYMKTKGIPFTTCERDGLLSHFAVHVSPIFYLLLPIYYVFPTPATLMVMQALVVGSGVIPLAILCRRRGISPAATALFAGIYVTYPAFIGGCFYYLHENNFLTPIILWMFLAFESRKKIWMVVTTVLLCAVKEDAAMYAAIICLYFLFVELREQRLARLAELEKPEEEGTGSRRRGRILGGLFTKAPFWIFVFSVVFFAVEIKLLSVYGNGAMTGRYSNYIYDGSGSLLVMFKAIFQNPIYVISECFTDEKLLACFEVFVPLGFLPLLLQYWEELFLLIPYVLMNLMSDYVYQHRLGYQYFFGSGAFLFYLAVMNYARLRKRELALEAAELAIGDGVQEPVEDSKEAGEQKELRQEGIESRRQGSLPRGARASISVTKLLVTGLGAAMLLSLCLFKGKLVDYYPGYIRYTGEREESLAVMQMIPEDASVIASTLFLPELSQREVIYELFYTKHDADYVIIDLRNGRDQDFLEKYLANEDYELVTLVENRAALFRNKEAVSGSEVENTAGQIIEESVEEGA